MDIGNPEKQWISEIKNGNVDALTKLVEHFRRPLFAYILNMLQGRGDPEDLFQEVWLRAIKHLPRYREKNFIGWLFRIARNLFIDQVRKRSREVPASTLGSPESGNDPVDRFPDSAETPDHQTAHRETGERITEALARLPEDQREVFLMRTEAGMSFKEIADLQDVTVNTALSRMNYALQKLRPLLLEEYQSLHRS